MIDSNRVLPGSDEDQPSHGVDTATQAVAASCPPAPPESGRDLGPSHPTHSYSPLGLSGSTTAQGTDHAAHAHTPVMHSSFQDALATLSQSDLSPMTTSSSPLVDARHNGEVPNGLPTPCSALIAGQWQRVPSRAAFNALPTHLSPSCPLDQILLDFIESRRVAFPGSMVPETSLWPQKPKVQALIDANLVHTVDALSAIISRVLTTFQHVSLPEKLAFFYVIYHTSKVGSTLLESSG